jgi:hypothetical protein
MYTENYNSWQWTQQLGVSQAYDKCSIYPKLSLAKYVDVMIMTHKLCR